MGDVGYPRLAFRSLFILSNHCRVDWRKFNIITHLRDLSLDEPGGKLYDGMGSHAYGYSPGTYIGLNLPNAMLPVEIDKINRKLHRERVDSLAGHYPNPFSWKKPGAPQQTS